MRDGGGRGLGGGGSVVRDGVVVVDDEPLVLRAVQRILAPCGHAVVTAEGLDELATWIHEPRLAVVVLDLFLSGVDEGDARGLEGLAWVRGERPDVEVVVMTGRASIDSAVACMRAGAFDYVCKPFSDVERLRESVRAAQAQTTGQGTSASATRSARAEEPGTDWLRVPLVANPRDDADVPLSLDAYERLALQRALREASGDASDAARRLGIGRSTFYRRAAKLGVELRHGEADVASARLPDPAPTASAVRVGGGPPIR